jgi:hypothetical protein
MAIGFECPDCRTRWPHSRAFSTCPECGIACRSAVAPRVLTNGEAKTRLNRVAFIRYYRERELARRGPTPEEVGRREALDVVAEIRRLNRVVNDEDPGD